MRRRGSALVVALLSLLGAAAAALASPRPLRVLRTPAVLPRALAFACAADTSIFSAPTAEQSGALEKAAPSPALQPREVISYMLNAFHRTNFDAPRARFGCEVALRFLAPSNPAAKLTPQAIADYLDQAWYRPLLGWAEYRWEGDMTLLGEREAYQQVSVRTSPTEPWVSVRWILVRVPYYGALDQWMVEAVFVEEPDGNVVGDVGPTSLMRSRRDQAAGGESGDELAAAATLAAAAASQTPATIVRTVMEAIRTRDEPYALHGCEVAIRFCSPSNRASRLSPQSFAQYLDEPWYRILTEWDTLEVEDELEAAGERSVLQNALVKRDGDDSWTVVSWQLSQYSGRWLTDALTITA